MCVSVCVRLFFFYSLSTLFSFRSRYISSVLSILLLVYYCRFCVCVVCRRHRLRTLCVCSTASAATVPWLLQPTTLVLCAGNEGVCTNHTRHSHQPEIVCSKNCRVASTKCGTSRGMVINRKWISFVLLLSLLLSHHYWPLLPLMVPFVPLIFLTYFFCFDSILFIHRLLCLCNVHINRKSRN